MRYSCFFILFLLFLLSSCGQVGSITGGKKDTAAPRVLTDKVKPPNKSTQIRPEEIVIPFDEFIEFNKAAENIIVTPNDVKLDYSIKKKAVHLKVIEGEWQENTTYTIFLNRAVRDITERNDSIISYVFSTGSYIDSLTTAIQIIDAYTNEPLKNITVGLYKEQLIDDTSKINPRYFSTTNGAGVALFQNIKNEDFFLYAFQDENRNNVLDATERRAGLKKKIHLDTVVDSIIPQIRLMPPSPSQITVRNNEVLPISKWCLSFSKSFEDTSNLIFIEKEPQWVEWNKLKDSVTIFYDDSLRSGNYTALIKTEKQEDTIKKKFFFKKTPSFTIENNLKQNKLWFSDTLTFTLNETIKNIDTSAISLTTIPENDSVRRDVAHTFIPSSPVTFQLAFDKKIGKSVQLKITPKGIIGATQALKDTLKLDISIQAEKEVGNMLIEFDTLPEYGILYITNQQKKVVYEVEFNGIDKITHEIKGVQPGNYGFHYLIDEDQNGKWSTGELFEEKEAEYIIWFKDVTTIRANWDVKTKLNFRKPSRNKIE